MILNETVNPVSLNYFTTNKFRLVYRTLVIIIPFLSSLFSFAQATEDLIGDWKISNVTLPPDSDDQQLLMLKKTKPILLNSTFHFGSNFSFSFQSPNNSLNVEGIWKFDAKKKYVKVIGKGPRANADFLMGISIQEINGDYLFLLDESKLILSVSRKEVTR